VSSYIVELLTPRFSVRGTVRGMGRFSDLLNDQEEFVRLQSVVVRQHDRSGNAGELKQEQGMVNKSAIAIVAELAVDEAWQSSVSEIIKKYSHEVLVYTEHFALRGRLHLPEGAILDQMLARSATRFIGFSDVYISALTHTGFTPFNTQFAMVNREQVSFLGLSG